MPRSQTQVVARSVLWQNTLQGTKKYPRLKKNIIFKNAFGVEKIWIANVPSRAFESSWRLKKPPTVNGRWEKPGVVSSHSVMALRNGEAVRSFLKNVSAAGEGRKIPWTRWFKPPWPNFIPQRWRSPTTPEKGHVFTIPKRSRLESPGMCFFFLWFFNGLGSHVIRQHHAPAFGRIVLELFPSTSRKFSYQFDSPKLSSQTTNLNLVKWGSSTKILGVFFVLCFLFLDIFGSCWIYK